MAENNDGKKTSSTEIFFMVLVVLLSAGIFCWCVFGFPFLDHIFKQFIDSSPFLSAIVSLFAFGIIILLSFSDYKKGKNFELFKFFIYIALALLFVISLVVNFI